MSNLLGVLTRAVIWLMVREAKRDKAHRRENDSRDCLCESCSWVRGIEEDADSHLGKSWR